MPDLPGSLDSRDLGFLVKFAVALLGLLLLIWRARAQRTLSPLSLRRADAALAVAGLMAFASWWPLPYPTTIHKHEFFHYYLGSKYSPELGYTALYDCVAAAEAQNDPTSDASTRWIRDLRTNRVQRGSPGARNPALCRSRFSPGRWLEFTHDVTWFREQVSRSQWERMLRDHGYNATPVWNAAGYLLTNTGPVSRPQTILLAALDPLLIAVMWALVWWAFGWRTMTVALLWWGTNYPARYGYIGGALLRSDWLLMAVGSVALARRGYMVLSGAALGWAALLRVFPGFIAVGALINRLRGFTWRAPATRDVLRLAGGAALAAVVLVPFSSIPDSGSLEGSVARWKAFADNSRKHLSGTATNRVSLKTLVSYSPGNRAAELRDYWIDGPGDAWLAVRQRTFDERRTAYWAIVATFVVLLALALRGEPSWVALVLGVGLIPILADITCYYYGILLVYAFLWERDPWIGIGLVALSAFSLAILGVFSLNEDRFAAISAAVVIYVFAVTARVAWVASKALASGELTPAQRSARDLASAAGVLFRAQRAERQGLPRVGRRFVSARGD